MSANRNGTAPATKADLRTTNARLGEVERHLGIKLERVDAKLEKLGEGMDAMRTEIIREIRERDERQSQRMDDLEDVVRRHSRDISAIHKRLPVSK